MTTPKKPLSKTESAIQLGNILKFGARGGGGKIKLRKIGEKASKVSKSKKIGEVQTRPKKSLQNQKPDRSAKAATSDAKIYNQPIGHGKRIGTRGIMSLEKKHPQAAMNTRIKAGTITQGGTKIRNTGNKSNPEASSPHYKLRLYKKDGSWNKEHVLKKDKK